MIFLVSFGGIHSGKLNMEPKHHLFENENHLRNLHFWVPFQGCMLGISLEITSSTDILPQLEDCLASYFTGHTVLNLPLLFQGSGDSYKPKLFRGTHIQYICIYIYRGSYYKAWMTIIPLTSNCKTSLFKVGSWALGLFSHEQWKNPGWFAYIGDYTTQ